MAFIPWYLHANILYRNGCFCFKSCHLPVLAIMACYVMYWACTVGKGHDFKFLNSRSIIKKIKSCDYRLSSKIYTFPCLYQAPGSSLSNALLLPEGGGAAPTGCLPTDIKQEKKNAKRRKIGCRPEQLLIFASMKTCSKLKFVSALPSLGYLQNYQYQYGLVEVSAHFPNVLNSLLWYWLKR